MVEHLISVNDLSRDEVEAYMDSAAAFSQMPPLEALQRHPGKLIANLFYEPSTRTSSSFYAAMHRLGGGVIPINDVNFSSVSKGENLKDTIRTMASYADAIVLRHPHEGSAEKAASVSGVPIINAGDGTGQHPSQALLDLYTIRSEQGQIDGLNITLMGDLKHGRTVHSLARLLRLYDVQINFLSPYELDMPTKYRTESDRQVRALEEVIQETDVLYVTRVQAERMESAFDYDYGVAVSDLKSAKARMSIMHPFPRVSEIAPEVDRDPRAAYFRQMKNGLFMRMAILDRLL